MLDATTENIISDWIKNHMGLIDSIIGVESGGNPNATNPNSSASGLGQFINSTWLSTIKEARPDLAQGKTDAELLALKTDPGLSREMTQAYANQNQAILQKNGLPVTEGNTYLAHFAGPGGAVKVLQADPTAPVGSILGDSVVKANPFLANMTAADLQAWASRKVGGQGAPAPSPVASAIMGKPQAPAAPATTPGAVAGQIMGQEPQAQPASPFNLAALSGGPAGQAPPQQAPQLAPIAFAQRRAPDLSKLRALFGSFS
jgi:hypothetical protein